MIPIDNRRKHYEFQIVLALFGFWQNKKMLVRSVGRSFALSLSNDTTHFDNAKFVICQIELCHSPFRRSEMYLCRIENPPESLNMLSQRQL